ncbi:lipocalin-like domain-containing protein [Burkholderia humptydooensis]|uniref:TstQ n=3 Tax=pseudomallei group TaxID=111527 RepID=R9S533_BURTH|nr:MULTISPECIES: lipocalin-like domain-containing protein [Burkholderia]AGN11892.1 TstQ [Burkholderia humptydooensis]AJY40177.1 lipocalin-like domain protein [Burkholderia sp. 2002721687]QPS46615.1 lipocalin-like domain-containing protein [Burkholderia humptydooensis]
MNELTGTWSLEASEFRLANGRITYPMGRSPMGRIIYTDTGYMSVIMIARGRKNIEFIPEAFWKNIFSIKKMIGMIRLIRANSGILSYSGKYSIEGKTVLHHVDLSSYPDFTGMNLLRDMKCDDGKLVLDNATTSGSSRLVWIRET